LTGNVRTRNGENSGEDEKRKFHDEISGAILLREPGRCLFGRGNYITRERGRGENLAATNGESERRARRVEKERG
jgi:hypothetical protein